MSTLQRSKSAPSPLVDAAAPSLEYPASTSSAAAAASRFSPEQIAAAKAARRASMLDYAKRVRREEYESAYAEGRAAAVRFLSPNPCLTRANSSFESSSSSSNASSSSSSSLMTPSKEKEDPFSLTGFFPSRPGSPLAAVSVQSAWMGEDEVVQLPSRMEEKRFPPPKKSLSMSALDDYAKDVIAREEQVGILSLVPSFLSKLKLSSLSSVTGIPTTETISEEREDEGDDDDEAHTPSTMSIDEPFDSDSLYASLNARRTASLPPVSTNIRNNNNKKAVPNIDLYSPTKEADDFQLQQHLSLGWADSLYSRIIAPVL